jgi:hypothetical protein
MAARRITAFLVLGILSNVFQKSLRETHHDQRGVLLDSCDGCRTGVSIPADNRQSDCWVRE